MITDEMVMKALTAASDIDREVCLDGIRAALAAVLPDIVEQCAKIADEFDSGVENIGARIRHLVFCPHSMNHRPANFLIADCIAAGECGCDNRFPAPGVTEDGKTSGKQ